MKSARAWRLKQALRLASREAAASNREDIALAALTKWMGRGQTRSPGALQASGKHLERSLGGVVRGMLDGRSNAYVEAINGLLQQAKRAARGFRDVQNFIAIAYLRMSKLKHLPSNPLAPAIPRDYGRYRHVC